jgi:hypothetical protein
METVSMAPGDATAKKREVVCIGSPDSAGIDKIADIGQATMANSLPVAIASDQSAIPVAVSNFPVTQPVSGTIAVSNLPATQPVSAVALPLPTGASTSAKQPAIGTAGTPSGDVLSVQGEAGMTPLKVDGSATTQPISAVSMPLPAGAATSAKQPALGTAGTPSADVISVQGEASMTPLKVDGSATTQPVSGTVAVSNLPATQPVSATALPLPSGAATSAKQPAIGTPGTPSGDVLSVQGEAGMTPLKVDGSATTQPISAVSMPLPAGAATAAKQPALGTAGTPSADVISVQGEASMTPLKVDGSATTQPVSGTVTANQGGAPWVITSNKSNNGAAPGATNIGTLPAVANAAPPSLTEGNQTSISMDLAGNIRVCGHPPNVLGAYMVNGRTSVYSALAAGSPLFSFRWGSATALAVVMRVRINVVTTTAPTANGAAERELIVARGFTASDTGGTAVVLTGNNAKMRTSHATSLIATNGDMRFGTTIAPGTRTLDTNPLSSVVSWIGSNFTGVDIGGGGSGATAAAFIGIGGLGMIPLLDAMTGQDYPLVLAQNEGFIVRIGKDAQPTTAAQQTYVNVSWSEVAAY